MLKFIHILPLLLLTIACSSQSDTKTSATTKTNTEKMSNTEFIYVMDPQCGWCYANTENINAVYAAFKDKADWKFLMGGMWLGGNAPQGGAGFQQFIGSNAPRLESITGVGMTPAFMELVGDDSYTFDSESASQAVVAVRKLFPEHAYTFSKAVIEAQFTDGKRYDKAETFLAILDKMGLDKAKFQGEWKSPSNVAETQAEFREAQRYARGFPTLVMVKDGQPTPLQSGFFQAEDMKQKIAQLLK